MLLKEGKPVKIGSYKEIIATGYDIKSILEAYTNQQGVSKEPGAQKEATK